MEKKKKKISTSTQQYLDFVEIKEDVIIMRDGTLRAIILVSSLNFSLKSDDEQNATIAAYISFLNSIDFPLQIVVQSRELNIDTYLSDLRQRKKEQVNELLKIQTEEYIQYIEELVKMGKIMSKRFYVIVPYDPMSDKQKGFFSKMMDTLKPATLIRLKGERFLRRRVQLMLRVENVITGLSSMGLNATLMDTQSLIELLFNTYNPKSSINQPLTNIKELRVNE